MAERARWEAAGQDVVRKRGPGAAREPVAEATAGGRLPGRPSPVAGSVWRVRARPGDVVAEGDPVAILEAMKTEINVTAPAGGTVREVRVAPGAPVQPGQLLAVIEENPGN